MPAPIIEEGALWNAFKTGDQQALSDIYTLYSGKLYNYGCKFTPHSALVEDAVQDLFVKLWHNKANLGAPASLRNYLLKSLRGIIFRKLEQQQRITLTDIDEEDYHFALEPSIESIRISQEMQLATSGNLAAALHTLTPRQKEAIFLRFNENLSYEEIAAVLSITVKATYKIMARALASLREQL
jgi:RNA polymerase sigma factor (sigma-70 family)